MELDAGDGDLTPTQLAVVQVWRRVLGILDVPTQEGLRLHANRLECRAKSIHNGVVAPLGRRGAAV